LDVSPAGSKRGQDARYRQDERKQEQEPARRRDLVRSGPWIRHQASPASPRAAAGGLSFTARHQADPLGVLAFLARLLPPIAVYQPARPS
jgi:hypothetical protein